MTAAPGALAFEATDGGQRIALSGALTMETVGALYHGMKQLQAGSVLTLDASGVTQADSSALALITTISRMAGERNMRVEIRPLPKVLSSILEIYGLQDILSAHRA